MAETNTAIRGYNYAIESLAPTIISRTRHQKLIEQSKRTPRTSEGKLRESLADQVVDLSQFRNGEVKEDKTFLYLAYGSNLCALTFLERRQIRPLSQLNVVVPELRLTFDLPGRPYAEPCFGNTQYRNIDQEKEEAQTADFHKDRWHKGLVGVVYEVNAADFAHILETEGAGAAYHDVLVDCYSLSADPAEAVPERPSGTPFKAHTLYAPSESTRPITSYAQPSARYMKLITDGADEHDLPTEYRTYLSQIRTYQISTSAQQLGGWLYLVIWGPILAFLFLGSAKAFLRPDGTYPPWFIKTVKAIYKGSWASYDKFFKPMFGDGERSICNGGAAPKEGKEEWNEKAPLLARQRQEQQWCEPGTRYGAEMV